MNEEQARDWIRATFGVSRENKLAAFADILRRESSNQNLISASTLDMIWSRHLMDSAQLVPLASAASEGLWLDVGSGAGLPGLVVATLIDGPVVLVEPRAKRVDFLRESAAELGLHVEVQHSKVETYRPAAAVAIVSARAVADLPQLLSATHHCTNASTIWVLPKGRNAHSEVEAARRKWQGSFHVEPSLTQPDSGIVVAKGVRPK